MELKEKIGTRIRELRKERKITQAALAEKTDLSDNFIGLLERGKTAPSFDSLERIAKALNVPLKDIFNFEPEGISKEHLRQEISRRIKEKSEEDMLWFYDVAMLLLNKMRDKESR